MRIVGAWESEKKYYNFANVSCNSTCGHYTQVRMFLMTSVANLINLSRILLKVELNC